MAITFQSLTFLIFSVVTLGAALMVVTTRNLFHAALYLMLSLFGVAGLFILLSAPLIAGFQVVVYIGAIAILIIFAIMLTPQVMQVVGARNNQWMLSLGLAVVFFLMLVSVVSPFMDEVGVEDWSTDFKEDNPAVVPDDTLVDFGQSIVDSQRYLLPFEIASILLMAALIGAVLLVSPPNKSKAKRLYDARDEMAVQQGPSEQSAAGD